MLAEIEGWRVCLEASDAWLAVDPDCFFIGRLGGAHIAHVSAVRYEEGYGFIGCFWVRADHRSRGFGLRIFRRALAHLAGCNVGISGVLRAVRSYARSGFAPHSDDARFVGRICPCRPRTRPRTARRCSTRSPRTTASFSRPPGARCSRAGSRSASAARVYVDGGAVRGYAVLHPVHNSHEIGPCFADTREIARALLIALVNQLPEGATFGVNVQGENPEGEAFVRDLPEFRLELFMQLKRMYTAGPPNIDVTKLWCPTGFTAG
jgi:GNAT superfamily N-acetyltransferase